MAESALDNSSKEWQSHRHIAGKEPTRIKLIGKPPIKKTIVPVIYIPGIFGSRLENPGGDVSYVWDPDDTGALISNYARDSSSITGGLSSAITSGYWSDVDIGKKVTQLHGSAEVMAGHDDKAKKETITHIKRSVTFFRLKTNLERNNAACGGACHLPDDTQLAEQEYERRANRGWFGVWNSYYPLLEQINEMNDPEFFYPVFAFGYDWRFDLDKAADKLVTKINDVLAIQDYPDYGVHGKDYDKIHSKVIIITHSQGSLVARYAIKKLGAEGQVQAVVHLDQPTTGAPVLYHRFITGTSPERSLSSLAGLTDNVFDEILGGTPYHFTRMAAPLTGALSLLPTNDYVAQAGENKNQWLRSNEPHLKFDKPITDVYDDVYLSEKWGLINCKRYDAAGQPKPYQEKEFDIVEYFDESWPEDSGVRIVRVPRHTFGDGPLPAGATILPAPADNPYRRDNQRLRPHAGMDRVTRKKARDYWSEFTKSITTAKTFHADLGLAQHNDTHVVRARGVKTFTQVTMRLSANGELECPLIRTEEGDGTVPLTSQEALLAGNAKPAGAVIQGGKHADICTHPVAMQQVKTLITGTFVTTLRKQPQAKQA